MDSIKQPIVIHWFRRDLRIHDNAALFHALTSGLPVLPVFIFDTDILDKLEKDDKRISFIYRALQLINMDLIKKKAGLEVFHGSPVEVFRLLISRYEVKKVFANRDYEPYARSRDEKVEGILAEAGIEFKTYKDHLIFEPGEILKENGQPYTVFTPFSKKWLSRLSDNTGVTQAFDNSLKKESFYSCVNQDLLSLPDIGFDEIPGIYKTPTLHDELLRNYDKTRNYPALDTTSRIGVHIRFGTVSTRELVKKALQLNQIWLNELIWREFFMHIIWHFPAVTDKPFRPEYEYIAWRNNENEFESWKNGKTGYPLVDAGMRELSETGFMHNRVRMVTASFLVKHLLIDWRWGEQHFARHLLDYELSSNNGNWQWAAGTGCDAAPYFRIFNPAIQARTFDPENAYIRKWVPESVLPEYSKPIVDHVFARERCLSAYAAVR